MSTTPSETEAHAAAPIPETMTAVVVHGPEDYRLETVAVPQPGSGELLLRVEAVGVCASDLKCYHGAPKFWGDENRPAWAQTGRIPGHEFVGRVVAGDPAALARRGLALGDRVACEQIVPCGDCRYCVRGQYWMCAPHAMFGFKDFDGAMAEYALVPARALTHPVSADLGHSTPRTPNRSPARCTRWSAPASGSGTSWSSPAPDRSASAPSRARARRTH